MARSTPLFLRLARWAGLLLLALAACGSGGDAGQREQPDASQHEQPDASQPPAISAFAAAPNPVPTTRSIVLTAEFSSGSGVVSPGVGAVRSGVPVEIKFVTEPATYTLTVTGPLDPPAISTLDVGVFTPDFAVNEGGKTGFALGTYELGASAPVGQGWSRASRFNQIGGAKLKWRWNPTNAGNSDDFSSNGVAIDRNGRILVSRVRNAASGGKESLLTCLSRSGDWVWDYVAESQQTSLTSPTLGADGTIYISATSADYLEDNRVIALTPEGNVKWSTPVRTAGSSWGPTLGSDGTLYVTSITAENSFEVTALRPDGTIKWQRALEDAGGGRCAPVIDGQGRVLVFTPNGLFAAINPGGTVARAVKADWGQASERSFVVGADGTMYVYSQGDSSGSSLLLALRPDGTQRWSAPFSVERGGPGGVAPALGADGRVVVAAGHQVHAVDPEGRVKWTYDCGDLFVDSSAPLLDWSGNVYLALRADVNDAANKPRIICLGPDGTQKWAYEMPASAPDFVFAGSPVLDAKGVLYVPMGTYGLFALGER